jgi:hypothetical protein
LENCKKLALGLKKSIEKEIIILLEDELEKINEGL